MTPTLRIAVSACLLGEPVRYDGQAKPCAAVLDGLGLLAELGVSGFVLKARSPSCGVGTAALSAEPGAGPSRTDGLLAAAIGRRFPQLPLVEDEGLDPEALVRRARAAAGLD
jgi:uncharacterized protein YbbK (DUF523 family)